ncbi:MAG TPA: TIGR00730 family Rossman fold protein [Symbiobacteriaceae bacterium]|nr:TIGR00730 family Rossman fold protein [Symbiobacteriaceae bacterium]
MEKSICVYCASSDRVAPHFFEAARQLGAEIARRGYALVYGGTDVGLMGTIARSVHQHGGKVVGVIPELIHGKGIAYALCDELIVTADMRERKAVMDARAGAFVAFPGGFGTLEEAFEMLTLKQLRYHSRPVAFLNVAGFYDPLLELFEHIYANHFAWPESRQLYHIANDLESLFDYLESYRPPELKDKWS